MSRKLSGFLMVLVLVLVSCGEKPPRNENSQAAIMPADIQYHVNYLASDQLEGRMSGLPGCDAAAKYIAAEFRRYGLEPLGDEGSYYQYFDFVGDVELGPANRLTMQSPDHDTTWTVATDFIPAGFSASDTVACEVVFGGYGIAAKQPEYDDYAELPVEGSRAGVAILAGLR